MFSLARVRLSYKLHGKYAFIRTSRGISHHAAIGEFVNQGPNNSLVTSKVSIRMGNPEDQYVLVPPEIGRAFQAAALLTNDSSAVANPNKSSLIFHHDTKHFVLGELLGLLLQIAVC